MINLSTSPNRLNREKGKFENLKKIKWEKKKCAHGVSGLNPNFEMAAFESLYSELHFGGLERVSIGVERRKTLENPRPKPQRRREQSAGNERNFVTFPFPSELIVDRTRAARDLNGIHLRL